MTEQKNANLRELTAPCGIDCFNCPVYLANESEEIRQQVMSGVGVSYEDAACRGCRSESGVCSLSRKSGYGPCRTFTCVDSRGIESCADCDDFPCDNLHPYADRPAGNPQNIKVYNLALIRKLGWERWAEEKAKLVRDTYFGKTLENR